MPFSPIPRGVYPSVTSLDPKKLSPVLDSMIPFVICLCRCISVVGFMDIRIHRNIDSRIPRNLRIGKNFRIPIFPYPQTGTKIRSNLCAR